MDIILECANGLLPTKEVFKFAGATETPIKSVIKKRDGYLVKLASLEAVLKLQDRANELGEGVKVGIMKESWDKYTLRIKRVPDAWKDFEDAEIIDDLGEKYGDEVQSLYYDHTSRWAKLTIFDEGMISWKGA